MKIVRISLRVLLVVVGIILLYLIAVWLLPRVPVKKAATADASEVTAYLLTNGAHTDIVMPVVSDQIDWSQYFEYGNTKGADSTYRYIGVGWGDKGFYMEIPTWDDLTFRVAFRAAFGLGGTAVHATYMRRIVVGDDCVELRLTRAQYSELIRYILAGLKKESCGKPQLIPTDAVYGISDAFYEAYGRYTLLHTCNTWTNNALKVAGQRACLWTATEGGIFRQYRHN